MLYLGYFSFEGERPEDSLIPGETGGWFTMLVEAESAHEALDKFADLIESLGGRFDGFDEVKNIYLEDATEIRELPPEGVLAHWTEYQALDVRGSISATLPREPPEGVAAFDWRRFEAGEEPEDGETIQPFYTWEDEED
jgi:small nuclear ribonucleoprotein (snRNP)-like protein